MSVKTLHWYGGYLSVLDKTKQNSGRMFLGSHIIKVHSIMVGESMESKVSWSMALTRNQGKKNIIAQLTFSPFPFLFLSTQDPRSWDGAIYMQEGSSISG